MKRMGFGGLLWIALLAGCASTPPPVEAPPAASASFSQDKIGATLWMQSATEYEAAATGSFNIAIQQMERALADPDWDALPRNEREGLPFAGLPPAVIVDADETMIDNSAFTARSIRDGAEYDPKRWQAWVDERKARAVPGALAFARRAAELGVTIYYVTNRSHEGEFAGTADNLRALGFPIAADNANLVLMGDPRAPEHEKGTRRQWIGARHRVLLMLGDNLGDFVDGFRTSVEARSALVAPYRDWWGQRWIMLPNPAYGSWESAIKARCADAKAADCLRSVLRHD